VDRTRTLLSERAYAREPNDGLAYFYFSFDDSDTHVFTHYLQTVLAQLCPKYQALPEVVDMYKNNKPWTPSQEELCAVLTSILKNQVSKSSTLEKRALETFTSITLIVDALDEIPPGDLQNEVLGFLDQLASIDLRNVRIIVVSRPETAIMDHLNVQNGWTCREILPDQIEADIQVFAEHEINNHRALRLQPTDVKRRLCERLSRDAQGM
jgi:hypothetical protein